MKKIIALSAIALVSALAFQSPSFAGDAKAGQAKSGLCAGCHGADGISMSPEIPNLKGQKEAYIVKAAKDYKSGTRKNPMMNTMVANVPDKDIEDIAAYFSSLK